jgi:8-oxo-dGTP pyrophosphatase MutT (NUDIX family)
MERMDTFIEQLSLSLKEPLPGPGSQSKMAPGIRLDANNDHYRNAAVLILLYLKEGKWHLVLMKRPEYPGVHSNQVSLPGGIHEPYDPDLSETALRESKEELGIDDRKILILGHLSKLEIPASGIEVSPWVGVYPETPVFNPSFEEVSYLIEVPLKELLSQESVEEEIRTILCKIVKVPFFKFGEEKVWGATAMILSEFNDVIRNLEGVDLL